MRLPYQKIIAYNCQASDFARGFPQMYEVERRDAMFAGVFKKKNKIYAFRDHLGTVPLYYREINHKLKFSFSINDLILAHDKLSSIGIKTFLVFGTTKLLSIIDGINIIPPGAVYAFNLQSNKPKIIYQYHLKPQTISVRSYPKIIDNFETLLKTAIVKQLKYDHVSLYLSGGIDSAIIALYLKKLKVQVHAFTSAPWGLSHEEVVYARENAKLIGIDRHSLNPLNPQDYHPSFNNLLSIYGNLHSSQTAIAVTNLWSQSQISDSKQIFLGQNSDTMFSSVGAQSDSFFLSFLPSTLRSWLSHNSHFQNLEANYIGYLSKGIIDDPDKLTSVLNNYHQYNRLQRLIIAGMLIGHTPRDGEVLTQPAIFRHISIGNPYYDMDVIEFILGLPLFFNLNLSGKKRTKFYIDKKIMRQIAGKYFPPEIIFRKKAFTVPLDRNRHSRSLLHSLPTKFCQHMLPDQDSRLAAAILNLWCRQHFIKF